LFKLKEKNTKVTTEIIAGLTTFFTMAYIVFVNPSIIADGAGGDPAVSTSVFVATCLASFFGTLLMGLLANVPFALAPGMGLNAFFAYTVMLGFGYTYAQALAIVFISGLLFILITAVGLRQAIVKAIPKSLRYAISVGIGLFIAFIGLTGAGVVVNSDSTLVTVGSFKNILAGDAAMFGTLMTLLGACVVRVTWITLIANTPTDIQFTLLCYPISWGLTTLMFVFYYFKGNWIERCRAKMGFH